MCWNIDLKCRLVGNDIGAIYEVTDLKRLGNNKRQPKLGDEVLCVAHSGDAFYYYVPLKYSINNTEATMKAQLRLRLYNG